MTWKVEEYIAEDGSSLWRDWFDGLHVQAAAKVATAVLRMEMGNTSSVKWFDGIGEYRIDWGPGYRIYLARDGDKLILLFTGGTKASQKGDIKRAMQLKDEYRTRKARLDKSR
ncbi:addiction module protein [Rhodanobacter sp. B05]|uniref:type II toxin-antitoxin system RelE/ParE family toxin n=1 Tax=Rhodanobacter sp. B05 TaxID=1945859 RepID=UPI00098455D1|nr:type II toxin-antitoxin system RelE/ParE family toxin [Rhodanobacter sp. B05]OOG60858.1 addiction module protein [Rhodanobacter sp. B05]